MTGVAAPLDDERFLDLVLRNPVNRALLGRLDALGTPDTWLVAGCLFQTVWNLASGRPPTGGIADYDIFYCDPTDPSWDAEDSVIARAARLFGDLGVIVEVRNQARGHLWYEARFGAAPLSPLRSSREGIAQFLAAGSCVGISNRTDGPYRLRAIRARRHRRRAAATQSTHTRPALFAAKAASYRRRWPWLRITDEPPRQPS